MIRLQDPGERGGNITVTMTPFDLLSLQEGLTSAIIHLEHIKTENPKSWETFGFEYKLKDAHANFNELEKVRTAREERLERDSVQPV